MLPGSHLERIADEGLATGFAELSDQFDKISKAITDDTSKSNLFNKKLLLLLKDVVAKMDNLVSVIEKQNGKKLSFKIIRDEQGFTSKIVEEDRI